jgi:hypothetical protein
MMLPARSTLLAVLCCALPLSALAAEEEQCQFDAKDLKPQLAKKQPKGAKALSSKVDKKKRSVKEEVQLADGSKASLELGGCAHVAWSIELKVGKVTTKTVGAEVVATSRRVLPLLVLEKDSIIDPARLLKALDDANIMQLPTKLPCGDATCQLSLELDDPKARAKKKAPPPPPKKKKDGEDDEEPKVAVEEPKPVEDGPALIRFTYDQPL